MVRYCFLFTVLCIANGISYAHDNSFQTPFEKSNGTESATYFQAMDFYKALDEKYDRIKMLDIGLTDTKYNLNVVFYSKDMGYDIKQWRKEGKVIIMINNGIHAGEPDGIDACMMLMRDAASGKINIPDNVVLAVIPIYNIGGALNRNSSSRTNQDGPKEYGFRGNAQNLDLNRDFIKMDAKESRSFNIFYYQLDPDIFIDNHVSDGADYQHVMTLLVTQHDKLGGAVGDYMYHTLVPGIYKDMKSRHYDLVPYVNDFKNSPDEGWTEFYDPPRFSSGYAALYHTFAFVPETHMLKPFAQRVQATYTLMQSFIELASKNADAIHKAREEDKVPLKENTDVTIDWKADTTQFDRIIFKGYEAGHKPSLVSGQERLYYDHNKPYERKVPFYDHFNPSLQVSLSKAYVVKQGFTDVLDRLRWNNVVMQKLKNDTVLDLTVYHIEKYETASHPYEKHYPHKNVIVSQEKQTIKLLADDVIINTEQPNQRLIVETLEPEAPDGFFAWGFFDGILQQKEYYSDYVFEDEAAKILENDKALTKLLQDKKKSDPAFAKDKTAQLDFVYRHSSHFEPGYNLYPVYKLY